MADVSTHFQGCWRVDGHHACAIHLLDLILRDEAVGPDEARRRLDEARAWAWPADCEDFGCHDTGTAGEETL